MNHHLRHLHEIDDYDDDAAPAGEIEFEEWDDADTALEVEQLVAQVRTAAQE